MSFGKLFRQLMVALLSLTIIGGPALAARTTTYLHHDGTGSVIAATNQAGVVLWRKDYAPFGELFNSPAIADRSSYTGKQHDDSIGLTYFGARWFDPELGRFTSVDPVGFNNRNTMSFNRYLYAYNNPYKFVDPDGQVAFLVYAIVFGVAALMASDAANPAVPGETPEPIGGAARFALGFAVPEAGLLRGAAVRQTIRQPVATKMPCVLRCFVAGTTVLTEHGYVPIEQLKAGDRVWAHDPDTGDTALKPIVNTSVNTNDSVWKLVLEKGGFRYLHEVTGTHPYYVVGADGRGQWTEVAHLAVGAMVSTEDGANARIVSLEDTRQVLTTYNIQVADIHTYYVSAAKVLVHNCGGETVLYHGSDVASIESIVTNGIQRTAARELGGGDVFWATANREFATIFAKANPAGGAPGIAGFRMSTSSLDSLTKSGAVAVDRTGAYMINDWKAFNAAVVERFGGAL